MGVEPITVPPTVPPTVPEQSTATSAAVELVVTGMTCAACSARIERKLRRAGWSGSVNYATGRASVRVPAGTGTAAVVALVEGLGFGAAALDGDPGTATAGCGPGPASEDPGDPEGLRSRLLVCAVLTLPVVVVSMIPELQFRYWQWACLALSAPVVIWGGWRFHRTALLGARRGTVSMDTLISLGTLAAFGWSVYSLFLGGAGLGGVSHYWRLLPLTEVTDADELTYLEVATAVVTALLAGRWIEARGRRQAGAALAALHRLRAPTATLRLGGRLRRLPADQLAVGDEVVVAAGQTVPVDGTVVSGATALDTAAMTGEPLPREVGRGARVEAGMVSTSGLVTVRAEAVGADTGWARMLRRVEAAQLGKARAQRLADRASAVFVPVVLAVATAVPLLWLGLGASPGFALGAGIALLIVACPCALGLATPTALLVGTSRAARRGVWFRGPEVIETARRVDTVVFDKTGTLTTGQMRVHRVSSAADLDADATAGLLARVAALEADNPHPIARALRDHADTPTVVGTGEPVGAENAGCPGDDAAGPAVVIADREILDGLGVRGTVAGHALLVGRPRLLADHGIELAGALDGSLAVARAAAEADGHSVVTVAEDGRAVAVIAVGDQVRPTAAAAVGRLRAGGVTPWLLTGDHRDAALRVAAAVGIDPAQVIAGVLPTDKHDEITRLQRGGHVVAMVGDGVNDAAALAAADLGLAISSGTEAAMAAADITITGADLTAVPAALGLARRILRVIRANLAWAFAYNLLALPIAALGLLSPVLAGLAMAASSICVITNSLRLARPSRSGGRDHRPGTTDTPVMGDPRPAGPVCARAGSPRPDHPVTAVVSVTVLLLALTTLTGPSQPDPISRSAELVAAPGPGNDDDNNDEGDNGGGEQGDEQGGNQQGGQNGQDGGDGQDQEQQDQQEQEEDEEFPGREEAALPERDDFVDITSVRPDANLGQGGDFGAGSFTAACGTNADGRRNSDNLVAGPGKRNAAQHTHDYVGTQADFDDEVGDLAQEQTSCVGGDQSTYYWPVVRDLSARGGDTTDDGGGLDGNVGQIMTPSSVDLTFRGNPDGEVVEPPQGLRMATGDAQVGANGAENANAKWSCTGFENRATTSYPLCPEGSRIMRMLDFPSCWDGENVDSEDHRSHLVFPDEQGSCPDDTDPVPALRMTLTYDQPASAFALDSFPAEQHKPETDHGDSINIMPTGMIEDMVECINAGQACDAQDGQGAAGSSSGSNASSGSASVAGQSGIGVRIADLLGLD